MRIVYLMWFSNKLSTENIPLLLVDFKNTFPSNIIKIKRFINKVLNSSPSYENYEELESIVKKILSKSAPSSSDIEGIRVSVHPNNFDFWNFTLIRKLQILCSLWQQLSNQTGWWIRSGVSYPFLLSYVFKSFRIA